MAETRDAVEFNRIIQADREKKRKQELADKIFSRRSSAPSAGALGAHKGLAGASTLASRITKPGQTARTTKSGGNPLSRVQQTVALKRSASTPQLATGSVIRRNQALDVLVNGGRSSRANEVDAQANIHSVRVSPGAGFNIKGSAVQMNPPREYAVVAQNFAPGTTAEDIRAVFVPDPTAAGLISCQLLVSHPTVIAELVFDNQDAAEEVVKKYNGRTADNRVLYVYHSDAPAVARSAVAPVKGVQRSHELVTSHDDELMDMEENRRTRQAPYTAPKGPRALVDVQDGRYGFAENEYRPRNSARTDGALVSDSMISRQRPRGNRQYRR
ncbi:uncharacterized protein PV09_08609 [Verruconis gallopava]|uniref:RRM domain-containing protein n=1 Tax=Verruconis gallopava TaxID=253628 RepID=A0A0D1XC32_9PEZI|nr:uncharacterized protein PV09_08609 [Verruconis gallopava]KIV99805.1 hypothetical protein PV09_08609 [Verruconis gallopava]